MSKITNDSLTRFCTGMLYSCTHMATVGVKGSRYPVNCRNGFVMLTTTTLHKLSSSLLAHRRNCFVLTNTRSCVVCVCISLCIVYNNNMWLTK